MQVTQCLTRFVEKRNTATTRVNRSYCLRKFHVKSSLRCIGITDVEQVLRGLPRSKILRRQRVYRYYRVDMSSTCSRGVRAGCTNVGCQCADIERQPGESPGLPSHHEASRKADGSGSTSWRSSKSWVPDAIKEVGPRKNGIIFEFGLMCSTCRISAVSTYFETFPYRVNLKTGLIDYEALEENAIMYRPKVLVAGTSAYCRLIDYKRMREIADLCGSYLMVDMAHISGLISAGVIPSPFQYADIVTTTTHKSLRGPRGAMIFFRKGVRKSDPKTGKELLYDLEGPINFSVFPGHQGGPHNHTITALAVALKQAVTPEFKQYQQQVIKNAKALEVEFKRLGYKLVADGTDSHMVLLDLQSTALDGARVEAVLEQVNIACNKNSIPGDKSALTPCGIRIGAPAMSTRGMGENDFKRIAGYIHTCIGICKDVQKSLPKEANRLKDFKAKVAGGEVPEINGLKKEVASWAGSFPLPV